MQLRVSATALAILLSAPLTFAGTLAPGGGSPTGVLDANSNVGTTLATTLAGEDVTADVQKVEQRFSGQNVSADALLKTGAGVLHLMTCASDATATAGSIILYDNTAESGTILHTFTVAAQYYQPFTVVFDAVFSTGLYIGYTTTADVNCTVSLR